MSGWIQLTKFTFVRTIASLRAALGTELSGWCSRARASGGDHEEQERWLTG
jgi:hypothetical protein